MKRVRNTKFSFIFVVPNSKEIVATYNNQAYKIVQTLLQFWLIVDTQVMSTSILIDRTISNWQSRPQNFDSAIGREWARRTLSFSCFWAVELAIRLTKCFSHCSRHRAKVIERHHASCRLESAKRLFGCTIKHGSLATFRSSGDKLQCLAVFNISWKFDNISNLGKRFEGGLRQVGSHKLMLPG